MSNMAWPTSVRHHPACEYNSAISTLVVHLLSFTVDLDVPEIRRRGVTAIGGHDVLFLFSTRADGTSTLSFLAITGLFTALHLDTTW